jgi:hypothetical protein
MQSVETYLGDSVDLITQHLAVSLGTSLSKTLSTLTTAGHYDFLVK